MDFDQYKDEYRAHVRKSLAIAPAADSDLILQVKANHFISLLGNAKEARVLDVGCGIGLMDRFWTDRVRALCGIDVSEESLAAAAKTNPGVEYKHYDGKIFPYEDAAFDAAVAVCVMHHVPPALWRDFLSEMKRVTRTGGLVAVFEHNPYNPLTRAVVSRCEFDRDAVLLRPSTLKKMGRDAGLEVVDSRSLLYFPWRGSIFRRIESLLGWLPLGGQYCCAFRVARDTRDKYTEEKP